jgi:hypothetical protein
VWWYTPIILAIWKAEVIEGQQIARLHLNQQARSGSFGLVDPEVTATGEHRQKDYNPRLAGKNVRPHRTNN